MKLLIHPQSSTFAPLKFGNRYIISPHILLGMCLLIHGEIQVNHVNKKGPLVVCIWVLNGFLWSIYPHPSVLVSRVPVIMQRYGWSQSASNHSGTQQNTHIVYRYTVYPKKYAHGFCFAVLCCGYTLTDFPISIRLTSLALWQSNDCPSASKATLMNMDRYFMWIHYERLHNHNKTKHSKTVCIFLGIYCRLRYNTAR